MKQIHTNSEIIFKDPYVVRIEYPEISIDEYQLLFSKLTRQTYRRIKGTWGHTKLICERIQTRPNIHPPGSISSLFEDNHETRFRAYFCFKHEEDALQFRLTSDIATAHVHMWPTTATYTIHEVLVDES
jgi:hypothetical protein